MSKAPGFRAQAKPAARQAFSILEAMIALTVMAIALSGVVGSYKFLNDSRKETARIDAAQAVARALLDRLVVADTDAIGDLTLTPWSVTRSPESVSGNRAPLTETAALPIDNLIGQELIAGRSGLDNLQVFIEYYRGLDEPGVGPGVMDATYAVPEDFRRNFLDASMSTWRTSRRLAANSRPALQVPEERPFVIRVLVIWGLQSEHSIQLFSARRRPSGV